MFNEVRVYNSQDHLTKIIKPKELSENYWKEKLTLKTKIEITRRGKNYLYLELPDDLLPEN